MLTLVTGLAGTGKTEYMLSTAAKLAHEGRQSVFIVPEQSSFTYEKILCERLTPRLRGLCSVKSFKRLCADIFKLYGGFVPVADDTVKAAAARRAISKMGVSSPVWRQRRDVSFCLQLARVSDELKNEGVCPSHLATVAKAAPTISLRNRLTAAADLCSLYETELTFGYRDDVTEQSVAADVLARCDFLCGAAVLFDEFSGFTHPEYLIITELLKRGCDVFAALCHDENSEYFPTVRKTAAKLRRLAADNCATPVDVVTLKTPVRFLGGAGGVGNYILNRTSPPKNLTGVYAYEARDRFNEAEVTAAEIRRLVREEGYRYSDIVVIIRDAEPYREALVRSFMLYDIPLFSDFGETLAHTAPVRFLCAAVRLLESFDSGNILNLLKTGLTNIPPEHLRLLEDYVFVWNIKSRGWHEVFTRSPKGFAEDMTDVERTAVDDVESVRKTVSEWLKFLKKTCADRSGDKIIEGLYAFMERCGAISLIEKSEVCDSAVGSLFFEMLERLHTLLSDDMIPYREMRELIELSAAATKVGEIPHCLEQVTAGRADLLRAANPRAVFCLGLNEGHFPKEDFDGAFLSLFEREYINEQCNVSLSSSFDNSAAMEEVYLYRAVTAARERVYLFNPIRGNRGESLTRAAAIDGFASLCPLPPILSLPLPLVVNEGTAKREYLTSLALKDGNARLLQLCGYAPFSAQLDAAADEPHYALFDKSIIEKAVGLNGLSLSPSRIESFGSCPFAYFLKYIVKLRPLKKAELSSIESGSFVHAVLERVMRDKAGDLRAVSDEEMLELCKKAALEYLKKTMGDAADEPRVAYLITRLVTQVGRLLLRLRAEQLQSQFCVSAVELPIGPHRENKPLPLLTADGRTVYIEGTVDRVDVFDAPDGRYLRVVDYKTGERAFSLDDVFYGLNLQMLIYLFSLCDGSGDYAGSIPAGVLYMPCDPSPSTTGAAPETAYRMDGLVLDSTEVVAAMEETISGIFIPVKQLSTGGLSRAQSSLASAETLGKIKKHIDDTLILIATKLFAGEVDVLPISRHGERQSCRYCEYTAVCRHDRILITREIESGAGRCFREEL